MLGCMFQGPAVSHLNFIHVGFMSHDLGAALGSLGTAKEAAGPRSPGLRMGPALATSFAFSRGGCH